MRMSAFAALGGLSLLPSLAVAQSVAIEHQAVGCLVAGNYPELSACFSPADSVAGARVHFRGAGTIPWYYVEMKPAGACASAVLPKPQSTLKAVEYYVDVVTKGFGESRTPDYKPRVADGLGGCGRRLVVASFSTSASVAVMAPAGAPLVPAGFSGAGVITTVAGAGTTGAASSTGTATAAGTGGAAGGGGASTALITAGVVGAAAIGAGIYVTGQEDPLEVDDDGDGFTEAGGDCDDARSDVSPGGTWTFTMDFAFTGSVACTQTNSRQQVYRVTNNTCAPLSLESLTLSSSFSGVCSGNANQPLALTAMSAPVGTTTVVRSETAPGTTTALCCPTPGRCQAGSCTLRDQFTLRTNLGSQTVTNSFVVNDPTGQTCAPCAGARSNAAGAGLLSRCDP